MSGSDRRLKLACVLLLAIVLVETGWILYPRTRAVLLPQKESPEARGRRLAQDLGCFTCHGPAGRSGVPNPGSLLEAVPSFHEGTPMMFVGGDQDLREYILDGAPAAKLARPSYRKEMEGQAIRMPAFRNWLDKRDTDALVAFVRAASDLAVVPDGPAHDGAEVARRVGCFACHGEMGSGGLPNPGSLKGYIPGFIGPDFDELVRDDEELRVWIAEGEIPRLRNNPAAALFLDKQRIQMPAYGRFLKADEIDQLVAYVRWLAKGSWREQDLFH
jgi:mono/diheme cytochrome c family protein